MGAGQHAADSHETTFAANVLAPPTDPFVIRRAAGPVALAGLAPGANAARLASTPSQYRPMAGRPPFITAPCCPRHLPRLGDGRAAHRMQRGFLWGQDL